jgi:adenylate cyclase
VRLLIEAGDRARALYANQDALGYFRRALELIEGGQEDETLALHERLGDLLGLLGPRQAALEHYAAAREAWAAAGRDGEVARLLRKQAVLQWEAGERDAALRLLHAGLERVRERPDYIEHAHLCQELGRCAFRGGEHGAAMQWAERALGLAQRLFETEPALRREAAAAMSHALNTIGIALARMQRMAEAVARVEHSVRLAEEHELLHAAGRGYTNLGVIYAALDAQRGIAACRRGLEIAKRIGDAALQSKLYANLAVAYCALTERCDDEGIEAANASARLDRELDQRDHLAVPLIVLGQIYQCEGQFERALAHFHEARTLAEESREPQLLFPCYDGLGTLYLDLGQDAQAERYLTLARQVCERSGLDPDGLTVLPFLV